MANVQRVMRSVGWLERVYEKDAGNDWIKMDSRPGGKGNVQAFKSRQKSMNLILMY